MYNELYHFGIKGMKWGVRRDRSQLRGSTMSLKKARRLYQRSDKAAKLRLEAYEFQKAGKKGKAWLRYMYASFVTPKEMKAQRYK